MINGEMDPTSSSHLILKSVRHASLEIELNAHRLPLNNPMETLSPPGLTINVGNIHRKVWNASKSGLQIVSIQTKLAFPGIIKSVPSSGSRL